MNSRKLLLLLFIALYATSLMAQTRYAKIIVYRNENIKENTDEAYKIYADDNLTTSLKNYHFAEFFMQEGSFKLKVNEIYATVSKVNCVAGRTYYFRINRDVSLPDKSITIEARDSLTANNDLKYLRTRVVSKPKVVKTSRPNGIGFSIEPGVGFEKIGLINTTMGDQVMHSFGGGTALGLGYSYEVSEYFGLSAEISHQFSILTPRVTNADVTFNQGVFSATPYFLIPVAKRNDQQIKLGGGVDYRFNPVLDIETEKIIGGFNDKWTYNNTWGYHLIAFYEGMLSSSMRGHFGLEYNDARFAYIMGEKYMPLNPLLKNPHANSLSVSFGLDYCF